jgi:FlaA1/EpsC-like NDP-sugar epimerase
VRRFVAPVASRRFRLFLPVDCGLLAASVVLAFFIRFDGGIPETYRPRLWLFVLLHLAIKIPSFYLFRTYHVSWSHVGLYDLLGVIKGATLGSGLLALIIFVWFREAPLFAEYPRSVVAIDYLITILLIGGIRASRRVHLSVFRRRPAAARRLLIVGAGSAGDALVRQVLGARRIEYDVVGFVDDDPAKRGLVIHGRPVLGDRARIPDIVADRGVDLIVLAIPSGPPGAVAEIVALCKATPASVKILPGIYGALRQGIRLEYLRDVQVEDLLTRPPVTLDVERMADRIRDRSVLVTGAGGSIGSELCRQIASLDPARLVLVGHAENDIFEIEAELRQLELRAAVVPVIADVRNEEKMERLFAVHRPQLVFHAAAHKHVPLMEANTDEAILNNVLGTKIVAEASERHGVERFVFISTDKAVNPTSVMGAAKRVAEMWLQCFGRESRTRFITVRFGNVLDSAGSVVPIFRRQIARGGPVTVTDPEMTRYLMTIPEAVQLILQACVMGGGGEIFVLDMGEPVRILDLATNMIRLSGLEPGRDVEIQIVGTRPGEKIREELFATEESTARTAHERIFLVRTGAAPDRAWMEAEVSELVRLARLLDTDGIRKALRQVTGGTAPPGLTDR